MGYIVPKVDLLLRQSTVATSVSKPMRMEPVQNVSSDQSKGWICFVQPSAEQGASRDPQLLAKSYL
jgi:hypothetical protein